MILLETHPGDARLTMKLLGDGFLLDWCWCPYEALRLAKTGSPDVILVGSGSFDPDGWIAEARTLVPDVPVLLLQTADETDSSHTEPCLTKGEITSLELQSVIGHLIETGQHLRTEGEVHSAGGLQKSLLPPNVPHLDRVDVAARCWPANSLSGDWYDFLPMIGGLGLVVGDVTGHDLAASLLMATTRAYMRALGVICGEPVTLVAQVNHLLGQDVGSTRFVTMGLLLLDPERLTVQVVLAGHPPPMKVDKKGRITSLLAQPNLPLGISLGEQFPASQTYQLESGDVLLLYTDGFEDVCDGTGSAFGCGRLAQVVRRRRFSTPEQILHGLHDEVMEFSREGRVPDDLTAVVMKVS